MTTTDFEITFDAPITDEERLFSVWLKLQWLKQYPDKLSGTFVRRDMALIIYEMKHHWTGYASKKLCNEDNYRLTYRDPKLGKFTKEHFLNLKKYTVQICKEFLAGKINTIEDLEKKIRQISNVHYVTPEENKQLAIIQTAHPDKYWKEHYELAGIELVKVRGTYNVDSGKVTSTIDLDPKHYGQG